MLATPIANKCTLQVPAVPASPSRLRAAPLPPLPPVARRLPMGYRRGADRMVHDVASTRCSTSSRPIRSSRRTSRMYRSKL
jgi:hypothetical protein